MKRCSKCKEEKTLDEFHKAKRCRDGLHCWCIPCKRKYNKTYNKVNAEHRKEYNKMYNKAYYETNAEHERARSRAHYQVNREQILENQREYGKEYYETNREQIRNSRYQREYGLAPGEYDQMHAAQDGKCAMCREPETTMRLGKTLLLSVDHCHKTGKVRALLCGRCNRLLGSSEESTVLLSEAIAFIRRYDVLTDEEVIA